VATILPHCRTYAQNQPAESRLSRAANSKQEREVRTFAKSFSRMDDKDRGIRLHLANNAWRGFIFSSASRSLAQEFHSRSTIHTHTGSVLHCEFEPSTEINLSPALSTEFALCSFISTLDHLCDDSCYRPGCAPTLASRQAKHP
jgi:hypothetical protein